MKVEFNGRLFKVSVFLQICFRSLGREIFAAVAMAANVDESSCSGSFNIKIGCADKPGSTTQLVAYDCNKADGNGGQGMRLILLNIL